MAEEPTPKPGMKTWHKVLIVLGGYAAAIVVAWIVTGIYIAATNTPDRAASSGMYAFGDSLFFLGVFGLAAIPATMAGFSFLRSNRGFWRFASIVAVALAATGVAAFVVYQGGRGLGPHSPLGFWVMLSPLRILLAPGLSLAFFLAALFAPARGPRIALLCAAVSEAIVFVWVALIWFHATR